MGLGQIAQPVWACFFADQRSQLGVALQEPAPLGNAIGHIGQFVGFQGIKMGKDLFFENGGMQFGDAIDAVAANQSEMGHAHLGFVEACFQDRDLLQQFTLMGGLQIDRIQKAPVDLLNQLQMARQQLFQHRHRPFFQGFGHDRVVGIRQAAGGEVPGFFPGQVVFVDKEPHQLSHCQSRVGIVHLDRHFIGKGLKIRVGFEVAAKDILQSGADKEILLF